MFEHRLAPLLGPRAFLRRQLRFAAVSASIVLGALAAGALGYHAFGRLPWLDALLNAAMILTGMGPVDRMQTNAGKCSPPVTRSRAGWCSSPPWRCSSHH